MDKEEEKKEGEGGGAKKLPVEQPKVPAEQKNKPKYSDGKQDVKLKPSEGKNTASDSEYASDISESSEVITNEFKDMYGESEEYEEMDEMEEGEEEGEEEEASEEEDLSEFKLQLEEKYMKGVEFSEEYLKKENKKIEDVPLQLYAIETYINSVRTFYGFANHWVRVKIFDSPCFDIFPWKTLNTQASLYANRSMAQSKGSLYPQEIRNYSKTELAETEIMSQNKQGNRMGNKRLEFDLSRMSGKERRKTIDILMQEEMSRVGTDYFSKSNYKIQSKEKDVGLDIPLMELLDEEELKEVPLHERRGSKSWVLREPLETGKTIVFPMRPAQFIHQLQRQPLKLFVLSTSGTMSSGQLELSGLTEAVIRASKGPPYPISSLQRFKSITTGDFISKVVGTVRVIAIGPQNVTTIKCEDNINDQVQRPLPTSKNPVTVYNMDSQEDKPSILTGPQNFTLYDVVKNIRGRRRKEKYKPPPTPPPKRYYVEDLVFNRAKNTVTRAPKKTYVSLRAEIDRYLVLNKSRKERPQESLTEEESVGSVETDLEERSRVEEEGEEEQELEEEHHEGLESEVTAQRIEAVFQSLIQVYGQNWANYKGHTSPASSASMVHERMPMKQDDSKNSFSSSSNWKRFGRTNPKREKH